MSLLSNEEVSFADAARLLSTDAALSAEVLRLANSPLGGRFGTTSILQALSLLGIARVSGLVLTLSVSKFLQRAGHSPVVRRCWRHNLACALAAKELAPEFDLDVDQAYMAGLLHDVGRLALLVSYPESYTEVVQMSKDSREFEQQRFGIDHCEAGAWLIRNWNFPERFAQVILLHHEPLHSQNPLTNLVHVACNMADQIGFSFNDQESDHEAVVSDEQAYRIASTINAIECEYAM